MQPPQKRCRGPYMIPMKPEREHNIKVLPQNVMIWDELLSNQAISHCSRVAHFNSAPVSLGLYQDCE